VQFQNNSSVSRQQYGGGVVCNGSTLSLSPFYLGNEGRPHDPESYTMTQNWGVQMTFMIPLNSRSVDLCKDLAKNRLEKQRLDYELVRINNCTKIQQRGFTLRPGSRFEAICNDVIPIAALPNIEKEDPLSELSNYYLEQIK
tara:strand:+ start:373 stop:798 length:426 start_codon:yes stop_codon:yes gene_type:complete